MKNFAYLIIVFGLILFTGCEKEDPILPDEPIITLAELKGDWFTDSYSHANYGPYYGCDPAHNDILDMIILDFLIDENVRLVDRCGTYDITTHLDFNEDTYVLNFADSYKFKVVDYDRNNEILTLELTYMKIPTAKVPLNGRYTLLQ